VDEGGAAAAEETTDADVVGASHGTREPTIDERELDVPSFLRRRTPSS
jgi:hypothetical protein